MLRAGRGQCILFAITALCILRCGDGDGWNQKDRPVLQISVDDEDLLLNKEWVNWFWSVSQDSLNKSDSLAIDQLYTSLDSVLPADVFELHRFSDSNYTASPFVRGYRKNLDTDTSQELIFVTGGLASNSLLFVLKSEDHHYRMILWKEESSFYESSSIRFLSCGNFNSFEILSETSGTTDVGTGVHTVYRVANGKVHEVLKVRNIVDISGTLKVITTANILVPDSTGNANRIIVHYAVSFWICNTYDKEYLSPHDTEGWNLYQNETCPPAEGVMLLNKKYGLLYSWSDDSLKYIPIYSPYGLNKEQHEIIEQVNSSEEYARAFFIGFENDIRDRFQKTELTLQWLDERFKTNNEISTQ